MPELKQVDANFTLADPLQTTEGRAVLINQISVEIRSNRETRAVFVHVESFQPTQFATPGLDPGVQKPRDPHWKDGLPEQVR